MTEHFLNLEPEERERLLSLLRIFEDPCDATIGTGGFLIKECCKASVLTLIPSTKSTRGHF